MPHTNRSDPDARTADLLNCLMELRDSVLSMEHRCRKEIESAHPGFRESARNLSHYLALRNRDLRELQRTLAARGLSSLGRAEAHVLSTIWTMSFICSRRPARTPGTRHPKTTLYSRRGKMRFRRHANAAAHTRLNCSDPRVRIARRESWSLCRTRLRGIPAM